jgi:hypothetical protein
VRVYAGIDPVSKKRHDLVETVPAGPSAAREAERVRTRLLNQVDERRNPRTKATLNQLLDRWLEVVELETTTRNSMEIPARNGLNSPSRHLHAPDCHAAHRQIATIRRCPKRASPQPTTVAVPVTTWSCSTWGPTGRRSPPLELLASTSPTRMGSDIRVPNGCRHSPRQQRTQFA